MRWCRLWHICKPEAAYCTGISFIDSTNWQFVKTYEFRSIGQFSGIAARGKTTLGWFYGFKLHPAISDRGELLGW